MSCEVMAMPEGSDAAKEADERDVLERYQRLPEPVPVEDTIASHDTEAVPDPRMGRDTERDFMLRYS